MNILVRGSNFFAITLILFSALNRRNRAVLTAIFPFVGVRNPCKNCWVDPLPCGLYPLNPCCQVFASAITLQQTVLTEPFASTTRTPA
jgi:hypothetical protein